MAKNIALIGFMGSGKSTVGRRLARRIGYGYVDTDQLVEVKAGKRVAEIFESEGEAVFRALERQAVEAASSMLRMVIACGGGAVLDAKNVEALKGNGVLVYLEASPESLLSRLRRGLERRPLLKGENAEIRVRELLSERVRTYESVADLIVNTDGLSLAKVVDKVLEGIGQEVG